MIRALLIFVGALAVWSAAAGDLSVTYLAASSTALDNPHDLKLSPDGRYLYVADVGNNRVAILDPATIESSSIESRNDHPLELLFDGLQARS